MKTSKKEGSVESVGLLVAKGSFRLVHKSPCVIYLLLHAMLDDVQVLAELRRLVGRTHFGKLQHKCGLRPREPQIGKRRLAVGLPKV